MKKSKKPLKKDQRNILRLIEIETHKHVMISELLDPIYLPKKPDKIDAINGNIMTDSSILTF